MRFVLALSALAAPAMAQTPETSVPAETVKVALDTEAGRIVLELDKGRAPITTANFLRYVDAGRFNGESFYRSRKFESGGGEGRTRRSNRSGRNGLGHCAMA